jgi:hypothetical protein
MAEKEIAPHGLLDRFSNPLWQRLGLSSLKPLWIVRSERRGYNWMVIELLQRANEGQDITTTVFMVRLPRKSSRWHLPGNRITRSRQICVDDEWVYVAELGRQPRVRDWPRWLDIAIDTADEVVRTASTHPVPKRHYRMEDGTLAPYSHPSWNPHDGSWVGIWAGICLAIGVFVLLSLVVGYQDWQHDGTVTRGCDPDTRRGAVLSGWKAAAWFGMLAVALLGICRVAYTLFTRVHKPGFALRANVEGILLLAVIFGLVQALEALERSARAVC